MHILHINHVHTLLTFCFSYSHSLTWRTCENVHVTFMYYVAYYIYDAYRVKWTQPKYTRACRESEKENSLSSFHGDQPVFRSYLLYTSVMQGIFGAGLSKNRCSSSRLAFDLATVVWHVRCSCSKLAFNIVAAVVCSSSSLVYDSATTGWHMM